MAAPRRRLPPGSRVIVRGDGGGGSRSKKNARGCEPQESGEKSNSDDNIIVEG